MKYRLEIAPKALKELVKLPRSDQVKIRDRIDNLITEPRPDGVKKLSDGSYRVRQGNYRIIYDVHDGALFILVLKVRNRSIAYR